MLLCRGFTELRPYLTDGGLAFIKARSDPRILITSSTNLRSDLTDAHPKPLVYSSTGSWSRL